MVEAELLSIFLSMDFLISLAIRSVVSGIILFVTSRFVGSKGGILAAMGVALLTTIITMFLFEAYVFPLMEAEPDGLLAAVENNLLGLALSYIMPGIVWFFLVMGLMKIGPIGAILLAGEQWLLSLALSYFGVLIFLIDYI